MAFVDKVKPAQKIVVRFLPPTLPDKVFHESIPKQFLDEITWYRYCQGKRRKSIQKESTNSRAYLNFSCGNVAANFLLSFHGTSFVDEKGQVFRAVVCYVPYQQVPRPTASVDKKKNTMATDSLYLSFVESLEQPVGKPVSQDVSDVKSTLITPLVQELSQRRKLNAEQKQLNEKKKKAIKIKKKEVPTHASYNSNVSNRTSSPHHFTRKQNVTDSTPREKKKSSHRGKKIDRGKRASKKENPVTLPPPKSRMCIHILLKLSFYIFCVTEYSKEANREELPHVKSPCIFREKHTKDEKRNKNNRRVTARRVPIILSRKSIVPEQNKVESKEYYASHIKLKEGRREN
ncbi:uncharacterized protein LOC128884468 [Hylaeus volcanicus]|uniref:uncharacterized protein LOC128884468 n=1 Tax=Hylaeus volcanicus TaxID=313075 RepID=UPI0023B81820|nr:uncharacterized protein LOC128884468 [Hylaeus volcanicus]